MPHHRLVWVGLLLAISCGGVDDESVRVDDVHGEVAEDGADVAGARTVGDLPGATCTTGRALGLAVQIINEMRCLAPSALALAESGDGIEFIGSAPLRYLDPDALADLEAAATALGPLQVVSGYRTVVQQELLNQYRDSGVCPMLVQVAHPGNSNHETGRAVDLARWRELTGPLKAYGFAQDVRHDPSHFDHLASEDNRKLNVRAFQRLWTRNHPEDPIDASGAYDAVTQARVLASPLDGFSLGACSAE
jgi:hypothetical protein